MKSITIALWANLVHFHKINAKTTNLRFHQFYCVFFQQIFVNLGRKCTCQGSTRLLSKNIKNAVFLNFDFSTAFQTCSLRKWRLWPPEASRSPSGFDPRAREYYDIFCLSAKYVNYIFSIKLKICTSFFVKKEAKKHIIIKQWANITEAEGRGILALQNIMSEANNIL